MKLVTTYDMVGVKKEEYEIIVEALCKFRELTKDEEQKMLITDILAEYWD